MVLPVKKLPIHLQSAQNRLLIKNGKVVNVNEIKDVDVYIEDGRVRQMGKNLTIPGGTRVIDASEKYLIPGGIDRHTVTSDNGSSDHFYNVTKTGIKGGTTVVVLLILPGKGETLIEAYRRGREKADRKVCSDYILQIAVTSWSQQIAEEMSELVSEHGVNSIAIFASNLKTSELHAVLHSCRKLGAVAQIHLDLIEKDSQKGHPDEKNKELIERIFEVADKVCCPLYVVPGKDVEFLTEISAKKRNEDGFILFRESSTSERNNFDSDVVCSDVIISDDLNERQGIDERMSVLWETGVHSDVISPQRFVELTSTKLAKILNIFPRKGCIDIGSDADIVLWNPTKTRVISGPAFIQDVDSEQLECHGVAEYVLVNGRVCVDEEDMKAVQGYGTFLESPPYPPLVYPDISTVEPEEIACGAPDMTLQVEERSEYPQQKQLRHCEPAGDNETISAQEEDANCAEDRKASIRVLQPPGGKSSSFW